jgi:hypothetical protein
VFHVLVMISDILVASEPYRKGRELELIKRARRLTKVLPSMDIKYLCLKFTISSTDSALPAHPPVRESLNGSYLPIQSPAAQPACYSV